MKNHLQSKHEIASSIHELNPISKLIAFTLFSFATLLNPTMEFALLGLVIFIALFSLANFGLEELWGLFKTLWLFFVITFIIHILFPGPASNFNEGLIIGAKKGLFYSLRLFLLVGFPTLLVWTTTLDELIAGVEQIFRPLTRVSTFFEEIVLLLNLSVRFLAGLFTEAEEIKEAQLARGIEVGKGKLKERIKDLAPLIVPLFVCTIRKAERTAIALHIRGYELGKKRTTYAEPLFSGGDIHLVALSILVVALNIYFRFH
jgi:energy-coupling factor transport system permease protein